MSKARNIADLLDANGDVKSANLDNVPPSNDASALTTGTLSADRIAAGSISYSILSGTPSAMRKSFDSTAVEGAIKNESGTVSVYASGAWKQIYPAVYS